MGWAGLRLYDVSGFVGWLVGLLGSFFFFFFWWWDGLVGGWFREGWGWRILLCCGKVWISEILFYHFGSGQWSGVGVTGLAVS